MRRMSEYPQVGRACGTGSRCRRPLDRKEKSARGDSEGSRRQGKVSVSVSCDLVYVVIDD